MTKQKRLYGTWSSPFSVDMLARGLRFNDVQWAGETLIWVEGRGSHSVLIAQEAGDAPYDLTTDGQNVRGRVGYGGGEFTTFKDMVYFAGNNGQLYKQAVKYGTARAITPAFGNAAAPRVSPDGQWVVYVHNADNIDGLALVDSEGANWPRKLAYGTDFVMQPTWHPDGCRIAYIAWDHPNMPWDGSELRLITLDGNMEAVERQTLAGGAENAISQPEFSRDGRYLAYLSDATGWGQLYLYDMETGNTRQVTTADAEHMSPGWVQGVRNYAWVDNGLVYMRNEQGFISLWHYDLSNDTHRRLCESSGYTYFSQISASDSGRVAAIAASASTPPRVISLPLDGSQTPRVHARSAYEQIAPENYSQPQAIAYPSHDGETAYGLFFPPTNARYEGTGAAPLIVDVHGGPTSQRPATYYAETQFYTSRGYGVFYPNHRGSTGYGRDYMLKLRRSWGIYDVEDSASGALYLASQGLADVSKLVIRGGSAGGYTVLQSLVDKPGFYKAGVNLFGVSNQFGLALETHKFEERYTDSLLGPLPDAADLYRARSPLFQAHKIVDPLIVFQGEDDVVVPRNQSDSIVASLKARGIPHEYHLYAGEGHGFRKPETLKHYTETSLKFLERYVVFS